jgi:hypothetical protein
MARIAERWIPQVAAILIAVCYWHWGSSIVLPKTSVNILTSIVTVAGVAVGFLAAIEAIVLSIDSSRIVRDLKTAGLYDRLVAYIHSGLWWSFVLSCISTVALFKDFDTTHWPLWAIAIWCGSMTGTVLANGRVIYAFDKILRLRSKEAPAIP